MKLGSTTKNGKNMFNKYCHILQYPEKLRNTGLVDEETMESQGRGWRTQEHLWLGIGSKYQIMVGGEKGAEKEAGEKEENAPYVYYLIND
jgi:hypothetical protein